MTDTCPRQIKVLRSVVEPIILPCVPPVLSVGQRVMSDGFDFIWRHGRNPLFITPWGQKVPMRVRNFVPHLVEEGCDFGLPSVAKSQEGLVPPTATFRGSPEDSTPRQDGKDKARSSKIDKLTSAEDENPSARSQTEPRAVRSQEPAVTEDEDATGDERGYRDLKAEAKSLKHLMTHEPKNPHCAACQQAKMQAKPTPDRSKRPGGDPNPEAKVFGDCITADHSIAHAERDQGLEGEATLLVVKDAYTTWLGAYPLPNKSSEEAVAALKDFVGSDEVKLFYRDGSPELEKAAEDLKWTRGTSTPGRPETNGRAERAVRKVLNACRTILLFAGLSPKFWPFAARYFALVHNITLNDNGFAAWERRKGSENKFKGF